MEMTDGQEKPERLKLSTPRSRAWPYLLVGAILGAAFEMLINVPLDAVFRNLFAYLFAGNPIRLTQALAHLAKPGEWPAVSLTGVILGTALGYAFYRLKENQKKLQSLRQEFEIQVATLRHHYKNLALGISGFSTRARRKLEKLQQQLQDCGLSDGGIKPEIKALEQSVIILENASKRLTSILTEELMFLKALQIDVLTLTPKDFFPVLRHAIQELLDLRFRDKDIDVKINGQPLQDLCSSLVFPFEPYTMEVILQNILSNAMSQGNLIQVQVAPQDDRVVVEIRDNGSGVDLREIRATLESARGRKGAESTQLGLRVTLNLLEKCGGRLFVLNQPDGGSSFILEFPK